MQIDEWYHIDVVVLVGLVHIGFTDKPMDLHLVIEMKDLTGLVCVMCVYVVQYVQQTKYPCTATKHGAILHCS